MTSPGPEKLDDVMTMLALGDADFANSALSNSTTLFLAKLPAQRSPERSKAGWHGPNRSLERIVSSAAGGSNFS